MMSGKVLRPKAFLDNHPSRSIRLASSLGVCCFCGRPVAHPDAHTVCVDETYYQINEAQTWDEYVCKMNAHVQTGKHAEDEF